MPQVLALDPTDSDPADCCSAPVREPLSAGQAAELSIAFKAIADPVPLRLLSLIQAHADGEACVCDLTAPFGLSQPTISHHLKVLHDAGLVTRTRRGTGAYSRGVPERLSALAAVIAAPQPTH